MTGQRERMTENGEGLRSVEIRKPFLWCLGPESNRHDTRYRGILSQIHGKNDLVKSY